MKIFRVFLLLALALYAGGCDYGHPVGDVFDSPKTQILAFKEALDMFRADCGRFPTTDEGLNALITSPTNIPSKIWKGPYMDTIPLDPWKHPYIYHYPGLHNADYFDLYSCGPDGISKSGGNDDDDINSWDKLSPRKWPGEPAGQTWKIQLAFAAILFLLTLFILWRTRRIPKSHGNYHGVAAVSWSLFVICLDQGMEFAHVPHRLDEPLIILSLFFVAFAELLAISGIRRGCLTSKICGWLVIIPLPLYFLPTING